MYQVFITVPVEVADMLEGYFCEEYQEHWMLFENEKTKVHQLRGYFENETEAISIYAELVKVIDGLPELPEGNVLEDKDWKEAYKLHFKAWSDRGMHFVPEWERDTYSLPEGDRMVLLDPGMAFGTGNHETTRLCLTRLLDGREAWGMDTAKKTVIDAGCGSGILAITAVKAGFGETYGFDNDPDSVRISGENAALCGVERDLVFEWCGLDEGFDGRTADFVMANILSPILIDHAALILGGVNPGGRLALSGILAKEVDEVQAAFEAALVNTWGSAVSVDQRIDGEWADILLVRP